MNKSELYSFFKAYGNHCMAYTGLEPVMQHFAINDIGYIAHAEYKHWFWSRKARQIVIGDPVCSTENFREITTRFIEKYPNVLFVQASREFAEVLHNMGFQVNEFGYETNVLIEDFNLIGKHRAKLRQWQNKCKREGLTIREISCEDDCSYKIEMELISKQWQKNKKGDGLSLLFRPLRSESERDARLFMGFIDNKLMGMAVFDPVFDHGKIIAYYHNIDRIADAAPHGTSASIILGAIETFKEEGVKYVALGMSPLKLKSGMRWELSNFHKFTRQAFWFAYDKLNFIYPFQGNATHKKKFNGVTKPVYISGTEGMSLKQVFLLLKAVGML